MEVTNWTNHAPSYMKGRIDEKEGLGFWKSLRIVGCTALIRK